MTSLTWPTLDVAALPDFHRDAEDMALYDRLRDRYIADQTTELERGTVAAYANTQRTLRTQIDVLSRQLGEYQKCVANAVAAYRRRYPHRVDGKLFAPPSLFESLRSLGGADALYGKIKADSAAAVAVDRALGRARIAEAEIPQRLARTLELQREAVVKRVTSSDGLARFHREMQMEELAFRVGRIRAERAEYMRRLRAGEVRPDQQRDRFFAENGVRRLQSAAVGAMHVRTLHFGNLAYALLRDLTGEMFHVPYRPEVDAIRNIVFDLGSDGEGLWIQASMNPNGSRMTPLEHCTSVFDDVEVAREQLHKSSEAVAGGHDYFEPVASIRAEDQTLLALFAALGERVRNDEP